MISKGENIFSSSQKSLNLAKDTHKQSLDGTLSL